MATLRGMIETDIKAITSMEEILFKDDAWHEEDFYYALNEDVGDTFLVIEENGQLVGYCGYRILYENEEILTIGTLPEHQKKGYGKMMMQAIVDAGIQAGCDFLTLEVRIDNAPAIHLYEAFGLKKAAIRRRYYQDGTDAYLMVRELEGMA